ncbi:MAG: DNA recombination protein RmuC, partial [Demequina sp.]
MTELIIGLVALTTGIALGYLAASLRSARTGGDSATAQLRTDLALEKARAESLAERLEESTAAATAREAQLRTEHERYVEQIKGDHQALRDQFQALSSEALKANQESFLQIANERLTRAQQSNQEELAKREAAVKQLVEPMAKALEDVKKQTTEADRARAETQAQLTEQIRRMLDTSETLGRQTESLRSALRRPEVRGRWGELHLKRVVEVAGLVNGVDFAEQESGSDDEGSRLRPDMIVSLSGGRRIVVDAKTPLDALLDMEAEDSDYETHAARHVENVRKRVNELNSKSYRDQFNSKIDFSVLFLPAESFLQVATERDP